MTDDRWRVWEVSFPYPMTSRENVKLNREAILPQLKNRWARWLSARSQQTPSDEGPDYWNRAG